MAHLFIYNYSVSGWKAPSADYFNLNDMYELCPGARMNRAEDHKPLKELCELAMVDVLWNPFTVHFDDDGEALAFMMIQDQFIKPSPYHDLKLRMILENPDWADIMGERTTIQDLERQKEINARAISNTAVAATKRKFKKFAADMDDAFRSFSAEFQQKFADFEKAFEEECDGYSKAVKNNGKDLANAKSRMKNRLNKFVVKKVKRGQ